jgi:hypothetical protein
MGNRRSLQTWSNIAATPAALTLPGGLYGLSASATFGAFATSTLTMSNLPAEADLVVVGSNTYRFELVAHLAQINDVTLGSTGTTAQKITATLANLAAAINGTGAAGVNWYVGTVKNTEVSAVTTATTLTVTALLSGTAGNSLAVSTTTAGNSFSPATDMGGGTTTGSITLQRLAPDGSTYVTCMTALTANGYGTAHLPSGKYHLALSTVSAVYADLVAIEEFI